MTLTFNAIGELREAVSQRLINLDFRQSGDAPFHSSLQLILSSPDIRVVRWSHTPGATFRDYRLVKDGDDSMSLIYPVNCSITVSHLDRDQRLGPGQPVLLRHDAVGEIIGNNPCTYIALVLPASVVRNTRLVQDRLLAERWPHDLPAMRLLRSYVSLLASYGEFKQSELTAAAAHHLVDLVRIVAGEVANRPEETDGAAISSSRLDVALAFLKERFRDPNLSVASAAAAQNISPRYLHKILERGHVSFTDCVNTLRLDAAHATLVERNDLPIATVALETGFSDVAHFNRLFKRRFGMTPRSVRGPRPENPTPRSKARDRG